MIFQKSPDNYIDTEGGRIGVFAEWCGLGWLVGGTAPSMEPARAQASESLATERERVAERA